MKKFILGIYLLFLLAITVFSYTFLDPNLIYLRKLYTGLFLTNRPLVTFIFILFVIAYFIFYGIFIHWFRNKTLGVKEFKFILATTVIFLFLSYPAMISYDIFNYIATAKVLFFYHENPYIIMPIQFLHDPLLLFMQAANKTALYAPFWIILTGVPFLIGFGNFIVTLFSFKFLNVIFYLASVILLYKMSKNIFYLSIFAFNPLVIIETLVSSHNDIVMMFLAVLAIYFLRNKKILLSLFCILFSILIKYATVFLLPVILYVIILQAKNKVINWEKIYYYSSLSMFVIFLLSPIRGEIYPWYAIWVLTFIPLISKRLIAYIYLSFSFGLLFTYVPFMLIGTYFGPTPIIKFLFTFIPPAAVLAYFLGRKIWERYLYS